MNVLLVNVHSALNLGDDAIMQSTLQHLWEAFPGADLTVAANDPGSWRRYPELGVVGSLASWVFRLEDGRFRGRKPKMLWYSVLLALAALWHRLSGRHLLFGEPGQRSLLKAYYEADLVLSCGGGNFYAHRFLSTYLFWNLAALAFAVALKKRVIMLPQSFGPIEGGPQRLAARLVFDQAERVMAREEPSRAFLVDRLGVRAPVSLLTDLAFGLVGSHGNQPEHRGRDTTRVGVTVIDRSAQTGRFAGQMNYEDAVCLALARLAADAPTTITVFCQVYGPTQDQDDRIAARRIYERLRAQGLDVELQDTLESATQAIDAYREMDLLIGSRMHTAIFGACGSVPVVLIGYQPKALGIMSELGFERFCCKIEDTTPGVIYDLSRELLDRREAWSARISEAAWRAMERLAGLTSQLRGSP